MAQYTIQKQVPGGLTPTFEAAAGVSGTPDTFINDLHTVLRVNNASASAVTVTIAAQLPCEQGVLHDLTGSVPAGGEITFGPFDRHYRNTSGLTEVYYSATASVTVAAISEPA